MQIFSHRDPRTAHHQAALDGAHILRNTVEDEGSATLIADGSTPLPALWKELASLADPGWAFITIVPLHLAGTDGTHPDSTEAVHRLWNDLVGWLPVPPAAFLHPAAGADPETEALRLREAIRHLPLDLVMASNGVLEPARAAEVVRDSRHLILTNLEADEDWLPAASWERHPDLLIHGSGLRTSSELREDTGLPA